MLSIMMTSWQLKTSGKCVSLLDERQLVHIKLYPLLTFAKVSFHPSAEEGCSHFISATVEIAQGQSSPQQNRQKLPVFSPNLHW